MSSMTTDQRMLYGDTTKQRIQHNRVLFQFLDHDSWGLQWYPINRVLQSLNNDITEKTLGLTIALSTFPWATILMGINQRNPLLFKQSMRWV